MSNNLPPEQTRPTFLIVDDDPLVRKLVSKGLAELDPETIIEVEDGLDAQRVLTDRRVDVVVTDVLMPNMDGRDLMRWAQANCPEPLWIVLSGLETFDAAVDALHLGAFDFLSKPPEVHRVRVAVRNALDQIRLKKDRERLYREVSETNARLAQKVEQLEKLCRMLEEQAEIIQADLDRAEMIQHALLPQEPPEIDGWVVETLYRSGSSVGGDFYDVFDLDRQHLGLVIADAAGHGVAAAMHAVLFKLRLRLRDHNGNLLMPNQVLRNLNRRLHESVSAPGAFVTAVYAIVNRRTGYVRLASAGHPPCIRTPRAGEAQFLERTGPALGLVADARYEERSVHLEVGDRLLLYTDGVIEGGPESPAQTDIAEVLRTQPDRTELLAEVYAAATQDLSGDQDDITMILLERGDGVSRFDDTRPPGERKRPELTEQVRLLEGVEAKHAFLSIAGNATWIRSKAFYEAAVRLLERYQDLTIDLGVCEYLDSTFLGTLHEIVSLRPDAVKLQRVSSRVRALFEELSMEGVLSHCTLVTEPLPAEMHTLEQANEEAEEQGERMLSAHETLASLSPENREVFRDVIESLRADLGSRG
ncbi:MAG: SpoIIE family protein phosphatase [Pseudomonadales bacterium]|jgi:serine phosphatase RsbU (regulator of sigma subunit)